MYLKTILFIYLSLCQLANANYPEIGFKECSEDLPQALEGIVLNYDNAYSEVNLLVPELVVEDAQIELARFTSFHVEGFPYHFDPVEHTAVYRTQFDGDYYDLYVMVASNTFTLMSSNIKVYLGFIKAGADYSIDDDSGYPSFIGRNVYSCLTDRIN